MLSNGLTFGAAYSKVLFCFNIFHIDNFTIFDIIVLTIHKEKTMERKTDFETQCKVVQQVCDKKIPAIAYFAAVDFKIKDKNLIEKLSDVIIEGNRPEWNFYMVRDVEHSKKQEHIEAIIKSKSAIWNCRCVQFFENVDVDRHRQAILESKDKDKFDFLKELDITIVERQAKKGMEMLFE